MISWSGRMRGWAWLVLTLALAGGGCAGAPRIDVPSTLPNVTRVDFLRLPRGLRHEGGTARAVGVTEPSSGGPWDATLDLYGLDGQGRIVSRGSSVVRPGFAPGPTPFEVTLVETSRKPSSRFTWPTHGNQPTRGLECPAWGAC